MERKVYYTDAEHLEATKKVRLGTQKDNFLIISINYVEYIVPHKEGIALLNAFQLAESFNHTYSEGVSNKTIKAIPDNHISARILSKEHYSAIKMAQLLRITYDEYVNSRSVAKADPNPLTF
jgi:hypothetical protein